MCPHMFSIILVLFSVQASSLPKNDSFEDSILIKFIDALQDEKTIDSWMKDTQRDDLYFYDLFKGITSKIRDVLVCIHTDKFDVFKSLIMKANMILDKISYPYYETFNIIESVKRIVLINDDQNLKNDAFDTENLLTDILYKEYDSIYDNLESTINQVGLILDSKKTSENYEGLKNSDHCQKFKPKLNDQNLSSTINFMELSDKMIEDILPVDNNTNSYVEAHVGGLKRSRRCVGSDIQLFIRERYNLVCPKNMWQYLKIFDSFLYDLIEIDLKNYFGKTFVCNKTTAKVLSMLFHFYSEVKKRNTKYEIIKKENNEYQIKWTLSKKASKKAFEDFWMKQEIQDLSNLKIIHKIGSYGLYSTLRSDYLDFRQEVVNLHLKSVEERINDAEDEIKDLETKLNSLRDEKKQLLDDKMKLLNENDIKPVKTKLFLLSCGHQLRFEDLTKFYYKGYTKYPKSFKCPFAWWCGPVYIVGCYDADLYKIGSEIW
uniref:Hypothetical spore wall protein n=1 Tax=Nosema bombycis TaxID=27978 RepID=B3STP0_NOSBO|nr:hypothetical spore wall protein [Nosema bombycis]